MAIEAGESTFHQAKVAAEVLQNYNATRHRLGV